MEVDRPGPGEELNTGDVTVPRVAASVIVLRDADAGPEVLLVQRNPASRFMGGAWVFPGGAVHADDGDAAVTAVRELEEEAGVEMDDSGALVPWSRWITPAQVKIRFDTWFFVALTRRCRSEVRRRGVRRPALAASAGRARCLSARRAVARVPDH